MNIRTKTELIKIRSTEIKQNVLPYTFRIHRPIPHSEKYYVVSEESTGMYCFVYGGKQKETIKEFLMILNDNKETIRKNVEYYQDEYGIKEEQQGQLF